MIQKLLLILVVASTYQISNASELDSPVSFTTLAEAEVAYEELSLEVEELLEEVELLEGDEANGEDFTKRRRRQIFICTAGPATVSSQSQSMARARAVSLCGMKRGKNCANSVKCESQIIRI